jgi:chromosome segregation ATPase
MADQPDNIVLEHLRHIRKVLDKLESDVADLKPRILGFETTMGHVMAQIGHLQVQIAGQTGRIDRIEGRLDQIEGGVEKIEGRLDRIEKRLDLIHA